MITKILLLISISLNIYFLVQFKKRNKMAKELILTFVKGRDDKVIARTNQGKICLIDIPYCKENHIWINPNEDWNCIIKEERENVIIVQPVTRLVTAEENAEIFDYKVDQLSEKFSSKKQAKKEVRSGDNLKLH